jgi:hypothetical protein
MLVARGCPGAKTETRSWLIMKTQMTLPLLFLTLLPLFSAPQLASAYYDPGVQRWINRDPIQERGFEVLRGMLKAPLQRYLPVGEFAEGQDLYRFVRNDPIQHLDEFGLYGILPPGVPFPAVPPGPGIPCDLPCQNEMNAVVTIAAAGVQVCAISPGTLCRFLLAAELVAANNLSKCLKGYGM